MANVGVNNTGKEYIAGIYAKAYKATTPRTIEVSVFPGRGLSMYTEEGDNSTPEDSIFGHAAVPGVVTCGAIDVDTPEQVEEFSSQGPVTMLTETRQKPDLCGVDGVEVSGVGGFGSPFYGTSAAAPHVAAVAALLWQQTPAAKPTDIAQMLKNGAIDLGTAGYDSVYGYGRLSAMANVDGYYVVKFNSMGGSAVASVVVQENSTIAAPSAPTKTGYDFAGWYKEQACTNAWNFTTDTVTASTTLYAKWVPKTYTVTFNSQGGSAVPAKTAAYNTKTAAPTAPSRAGYSFGGWYKETAYTNAWNFAADTVKANTTLYAKWVAPPPAPSSVKAVARDYQSITVSWAAVSGGAAGYELYRATSSTGSYALIKTLTGTSCTDGSLTTGSTYYYKVRAWRTLESHRLYGGYSSVVSAKPVLATPTTVKAQSAAYHKVKVTWQAVSGAGGYALYHATSSAGSYSLVSTISSASTVTYTEGALKTGQTYYYKVRAWRKVANGTVYSGYSAIVSAKPTLGTPGGFTGSSVSYQSVRLGWDDVSGASGYQVYRATSKTGTYKAVGETSSEGYTNSGLTTNKTYYYKVRAYRKVGSTKVYGSFTSVLSAKPVLGVPKSVKAVRASSSSIKVNWNKVTGATGYQVYRATAAAGTYTLVKTVKATTEATQTYTNTSLTNGKSYYYKVRAIRTKSGKTYTSGYSAVVTAKP